MHLPSKKKILAVVIRMAAKFSPPNGFTCRSHVCLAMVLRPLCSEICGWHETAHLQVNMVLFNAISIAKQAKSGKLGRLLMLGSCAAKGFRICVYLRPSAV